eukprot:gene13661-16088_t
MYGKYGLSIGWNETFQKLLLLPEDDQNKKFVKYKHLSSLSKDFLHSAVAYGKIIIEEAFLDVKYKTIRSVPSLGGQAGGEKYIYNGILFKFASDWIGIYGNDEFSMKAGGHELKSVMRYYGCEGIHVPLMALLDHRGFRLVAMSILPIAPRRTIVYGSADAGKTVHASLPDVNERMRLAAAKLNVKGHLCGAGDKQQLLYGPTDIEGHMGTDGLFYVLDFARVFPPTADRRVDDTFLYRLFRPEFVQTYHLPLSSDSFSPFGKLDTVSAAVNNREVREATEYLAGVCVPKVAEWMDARVHSVSWYSQLTEIIHREGINVRYLGLVRAHVTSPELKRVLLTEIVARVFKNIIRADLRDKMKELRSIEADSYVQVVMDFFNIILGDPLPRHEKLWRTSIKPEIINRFDNSLTIEERDPNFDLSSQVDMYHIFVRIQNMTGIKLADESMKELMKDPRSFRVVLSDITSMDVKVKHMNIISLAEGNALSLQCMKWEGRTGSERLFKLATNKFEEAIRSTPDNKDILNDYANVLMQLALSVGKNDCLVYLERSFSNFLLANNYMSLLQLGDLLHSLFVHEEGYLWTSRDRICDLAERAYSAVAHWGHESPGTRLLNSSIEIVSRRSSSIPAIGEETRVLAFFKLASLVMHRALETVDSSLFARAGSLYKEGFKPLLATPSLAPSLVVPPSIISRSPQQIAIWAQLFLAPLVIQPPAFHTSSGPPPVPTLPSLVACPVISTLLFSREFLTPDLLAILATAYPSRIAYLGLRKYAHELKSSTLKSVLVALGPQLTKLDISRISSIDNASATTIATHCPILRSINISATAVTSQGLVSLLAACTSLHRIVAAKCRLDDRDFGAYAMPSWRTDYPLTCLDISSTEVKYIGSLAAGLPHLKHINLTNCLLLQPSELAKLANSCPSLTQVSIAGCPLLTDESVHNFTAQLSHLSRLDVASCRISHVALLKLDGHLIQRLDVSNCKVRTMCLSLLTRLTHINLTNTGMSIDVVPDLLASAPGLESLILNNHSLAIDIPQLKARIRTSLAAPADTMLPTLKLLRLELQGAGVSPQVLQGIISRAPSLTSLNLANNELDDSLFTSIAATCPSLTSLNVASCKAVTDACIEPLVRNCRKITILMLSSCHLLTDNSITAITTYLHRLEKLSVKKCPLITELAALPLHCPFLSELDVSGAENISDISIAAMGRSPRLRYVNIHGCKRVTDEALRALGEARRLKVLELGLNKTSDSAVEALRSMRPELRVVASGGGSSSSASVAPTFELSSATRKSLMADLKNIKTHAMPLVSAEPVGDSLLVWHANIVAPLGSPFEGGIFHLELKFPPTYPANPPSGVLLTPFPHPHVHDGGRICLDILADFQSYFRGHTEIAGSKLTGWSSAYSVQTILLQIQTFLISLEDDDASHPIQDYLVRVPEAIANSRSFKCASCPHRGDAPWPELPTDDQLNALKTSSSSSSLSDSQLMSASSSSTSLDSNNSAQPNSPPSALSTSSTSTTFTSTAPSSVDESDYIASIESELMCYHTRVSYKEDVIGIGITVITKSPKSSRIDEIRTSLDLLSQEAFNQGVRSSVLKESFTHWLPLYINAQHGQRAWTLLENSLATIFHAKQFRPDLARVFLCKAMNTMCVQIMNETLHASLRLLEGYCLFHQLFLAFIKRYPQMLVDINKEIYDFIHLPGKRHKKDTPALGEFLPLLTVSDYKWSEVANAYLEENFDRNVMWIVKNHPGYGSTTSDAQIDQARPQMAFESSFVSIRLLLFHVYFLQHLARPEGSTLDSIGAQYNRLLGKPPPYIRDNLQKAVKEIKCVRTWDEFFSKIGLTPPSESDLAEWLKRSVGNSIAKNYHRDTSKPKILTPKMSPANKPNKYLASPSSSQHFLSQDDEYYSLNIFSPPDNNSYPSSPPSYDVNGAISYRDSLVYGEQLRASSLFQQP